MESKKNETVLEQEPKFSIELFLNNPISDISIIPYSEESGVSTVRLKVDHHGKKYFLNVAYGIETGSDINSPTGSTLDERLRGMVGKTLREVLDLGHIPQGQQ